MKKNLRIVSAAAALLAVAPVAASAVSVNAAAITNVTLGSNNAPAVASDITVSSNLQAITKPDRATTDLVKGQTKYDLWDGQINGTLSASFGGQTYTANLTNPSNVTIYYLNDKANGNTLSDYVEVKKENGRYKLEPGKKYFVRVDGIGFNFGPANANRNKLTLAGSNDVKFFAEGKETHKTTVPTKSVKVGDTVAVNGLTTSEDAPARDGFTADKKGVEITAKHNQATVVKASKTSVTVTYETAAGNKHVAVVGTKALLNNNTDEATVTVTNPNTLYSKMIVSTDSNGAMVGKLDAFVPVTPTDVTNSKSVSFYEIANGNEVTTGSLNLTANPTSHELNVNAVLAAAKAKYAAHQLENGASNGANVSVTTDVKDLTDQLTKAGLKVDALGNFEAPASFSFNLTAKSAQNAATATLPVTVSVANAVQTPAAQETTRTVKIMHISTIYDKNGKATHEPALRAYHTVSVVSDPVSLKDEKGNDAGKFYKLAGKDQYIKVGNVDGTKRTLKHNSYVYKSTGKRRGKTVLKKGSSVTTYGKSFMIAGHQMYRIGENKYVKKANF